MGDVDKSVRKLGRDEMNLAEFPLAVLTDTVPEDVKTLVYEQADGRKVTITASDAYGLPTAVDLDVLVGLVNLTRSKNDFRDRKLSFNLQELLETLGLADDGRSFKRVRESLLRWHGVQLVYDKAWYDNSKKKNGEARGYQTTAFHLIETVDIRDGRARGKDGPQSSILWNQTFFESCQADFLKELDLDTYFGFRSAVTKRAYRYLDKRLHKKTSITFDLAEFAFVHVGLSRGYEGNAGKIKAKLRPAIAELEAVGFLRPMDEADRYTKKGKGQWMVHFHRGDAVAAKPAQLSEPAGQLRELIDLKVKPPTARALVDRHDPERIARNVAYFKKESAKKRKGPGYLVKAIEDDYAAAEPAPTVQATFKLEVAVPTPEEKAQAEAEARWCSMSDEEREAARKDALTNAGADKLTEYEGIPKRLKQVYLDGLARERMAAELAGEV